MKVYLLWEDNRIDYQDLKGVFSTREKAEADAKRRYALSPDIYPERNERLEERDTVIEEIEVQ